MHKHIAGTLVISLFFSLFLTTAKPIHIAHGQTEVVDPGMYIPKDVQFVFELDLRDKNQYDIAKMYLERIKEVFIKPLEDSGTITSSEISDHLVDSIFKRGNMMTVGLHISKVEDEYKTANTTVISSDENLLEIILEEDQKQNIQNQKKQLDDKTFYYERTPEYEGAESSFMAGVENAVIFTYSLEDLQKSIGLSRENSILSDEELNTIKTKLDQPYIIGAHINLALLLPIFPEATTENFPTADEMMIFAQRDMIKQLEKLAKRISFSLKLDTSGIQINAHALGDQGKMDEINFHYDDLTVKQSLISKFPKATPFLFGETANVKKAVELNQELSKDTENNEYSLLNNEQKFFEETGLHLKEDVLSWMDKEFAYAIQDTGTLIPAATIMVNAQSNPEKARNFVSFVDKKLTEWLQEEGEKHVLKSEVTVDSITFNKLLFDLPSLILEEEPDMKNKELLLKEVKPMEFVYGLTADNTFIITTFPSFEQHYKENLENDDGLAQGFKDITLGNGERGYFNLREIWNYLDHTIETAFNIEGELPEMEGYRIYYTAQEWLYKFKNMTWTKNNQKYETSSSFLISISEDEPKTNFEAQIQKYKNRDSDEDGENDYKEAFLYGTDPFQEDSPASTEFTDIPKKQWYAKAVGTLNNRYIVGGYNNDDGTKSFQPQKPITRAEFVKMAVTAFDVPADYEMYYIFQEGIPSPEKYPNRHIFSDVTINDWYFDPIYAAEQAGIITGHEDRTFRPNEPISRAEALIIAIRASNHFQQASPQAPFSDTKGHWSEAYVNYAHSQGLIKGVTATSFDPNRAINRAEAAMMIFKLMEFDLMQTEPNEITDELKGDIIDGIREFDDFYQGLTSL